MTSKQQTNGVVRDQQSEIYLANTPCILRFITGITRAWGIVTVAVLWGCTVKLMGNFQEYEYTPWYLVFVSLLVTFLEVLWIIDKSTCCRDEGCCCVIWKTLIWIDNWRKTILYWGLSIPCFGEGMNAMLALLSGLVLIVAGGLYLVKSFRNSTCVRKKARDDYINVASPNANLVSHEVQTDATEKQDDNGQTYAALGQTTPVQPPNSIAQTNDAARTEDEGHQTGVSTGNLEPEAKSSQQNTEEAVYSGEGKLDASNPFANG